MSYIFGPVPSRRLGRSLGVDLVPFKTCSYDCIYCQLGRTTNKTIQRKEWVPLDDVLAELKGRLSSQPDYITLSGSGEPTLYSRMGELIDQIKAMTDVPVAVLTNGGLLWDKAVRGQLANADLIVPSLDAGDEAMFQAVNRPHESISFEKMLNGLIDFRREFQGQYWLEVLLLAGHNAGDAEVEKLVNCVSRIKPDRVQLNTATRPPAEDYAVTVERQRLEELAAMFSPPAEVIADFRGVHQRREFAAGRESVLELLRRRPCSIDDIAGGLGMHRNEIVKYIEELSALKAIEHSSVAGKLYYKATERLQR
ncbi:MAG: radical SAM protein [Phycisphaerae bacterium]|nr:radical SAM protein [Phycisphaerae bacterium]